MPQLFHHKSVVVQNRTYAINYPKSNCIIKNGMLALNFTVTLTEDAI